jgi:tetratricopeptide (TPR) repeat protein
MNLSTLERMAGQGDLSREAFRYLLDCRGECEWLDYKESLKLDEDAELCAFAKDVLAFKNVGGGYLLVGVKDKTWDQIGLTSVFPYDSKQLRDKILRATGIQLDIDVVDNKLVYDKSIKHFALILIRSSRKRSKRRSPTLAAKDFCAKLSFGIRRGDIYVRKGDSTIKLDRQTDLEDLLDRLEEQADRDSLLADVTPSFFAVENGTYRLLDRGYDAFIGRTELRTKLLDAINGDPRIWIINVHGPGGVGKSALVNWAAYELYHSKKFEAILHLTAKETILTETGIRPHTRSLYSLENLLDQILVLFQEITTSDLETKKSMVNELLSAWRTLIILDNLETVSDGRILSFVQALPAEIKSKILITSRTKTGGWELPIPVIEMNQQETFEFIKLKSSEMQIEFPLDEITISKVTNASGGLPLAVQWILGQYKRTERIDSILTTVTGKDSPVLEFSFRNVWKTLSSQAQTVLALMSIFDGPTSAHQLSVASQMPFEGIERAFVDLLDVTLVNKTLQQSDGRILYSALPITLAFARNELSSMGDLELHCRRRVQEFNEQMEIQAAEIGRFQSDFERYGITTANEKRAAILCRRAESEMFSGNVEGAELLFKQARDLCPISAYVFAKSASYELARNRVGVALDRIAEACRYATKRTGSLCYSIKARIYDVQLDRTGRRQALKQALEFDPNDTIIRHQYGVALSRSGAAQEAVDEFSKIIEIEESQPTPRETLILALTTRVINLRRLGRIDDANKDLARAKDIINKFPFLSSASTKLSELEQENSN